MTFLKLCGLCLLAACLLLLLREAGGRYLPLIALSGGVILLLYLFEELRLVTSFLEELAVGDTVSDVLSLSLRVLGLCFLTELTASLCRDMGEGGLASRLELCGRVEILLVSLPTLSRLIEAAVTLIG